MDAGQNISSVAKWQQELEDLCRHPGIDVRPELLDDATFEKISKSMIQNGLLSSWTERPRTYFILHQIGRSDLMPLFVMHDFDDGSIPYANRGALPRGNPPVSFNPQEAHDFLKWQSICETSALLMEHGKHCSLSDGEVLFVSQKILGRGSANVSVVDKVVSKATRRVYARKRIRRNKFPKEAQRNYNRELQNLKKAGDHTHLIKVRASYTDKKYFGLLLEPVAEENLKAYLLRVSADDPEVRAQLCSYYGCMANVISFLHGTMMLHKDIKSENFLISKGRLILTDFGTSFDWSEAGQSMTMSNAHDARTPRYISPEVAKDNRFHRASDIWSLGVVYLEMTTVLRGEKLSHLEQFLVNEDEKTSKFWANLTAVRRWMQKLTDRPGPPDDNEPLAWARRMLDPVMDNRPSAPDLYSSIVTFQMSRFCGSCCVPADVSDASSQSDLLESDDETTIQPFSAKSVIQSAEQDNHVPGAFPMDNHYQQPLSDIANHLKQPEVEPNTGSHPRSDQSVMVRRLDLDHAASSNHQERRLIHRQPATTLTVDAQSKMSAIQTRPAPRYVPKGILAWLSNYRSPRPRPAAEPQEPEVTIQSQRVNHFLSTLPSTSQLYDAMPNQSHLMLPSLHENGNNTSNLPSAEAPDHGDALQSKDDINSNNLVNEQNETSTDAVPELVAMGDLPKPDKSAKNPVWADMQGPRHRRNSNTVNISDISLDVRDIEDLEENLATRLIHFPSEGDLRSVAEATSQSFMTTIADLKATKLPVTDCVTHSAVTSTQVHQESLAEDREVNDDFESHRDIQDDLPPTISTTPANSDAIEAELDDSKTSSRLTNIHNSSPRNTASASIHRQVRFERTSTKSQRKDPPSTLASYVNQVSDRQRKWESASAVMERILKDRASIAATSEISARTRKLVTQSKPLLCWNDKVYNYLGHFIRDGKVQAVRELLRAGCNPGTKAKPRRQLILLAIKGRTHKHNKILLELLRYKADVNAVGSNGKTYLHYAISQKLWSGYSQTVYLLLMHGIELNRADSQGVIPFVQLLLGGGPLAVEERDALLLLLAPNFDARIDGLETTLEDNILHLAIRRKDPYALDAILGKAETNRVLKKLLSKRNASGFTPIMLVMQSFTFKDREESDIGLRLLQLLLEAGADPNQPLYLAVGTYRNLDLLILLLKHNADPKIKGQDLKSPADLLLDGISEDSSNAYAWYKFLFDKYRNDQRWFG